MFILLLLGELSLQVSKIVKRVRPPSRGGGGRRRRIPFIKGRGCWSGNFENNRNPLKVWYRFENSTLTDISITFNSIKDDCFEYLLLAKLIFKPLSPGKLFSAPNPKRHRKHYEDEHTTRHKNYFFNS